MINEKQLYTVTESYTLITKALQSMKYLMRARKSNELQMVFIERIMLAVTEVNKCPMCSYAHTKIALEAGMSADEIEHMLHGVLLDVPKEEMPAILFAQHYADSRGKPLKEALRTLVDIYGLEKARGILGAVRAIMVGNAYGIAWGSLMGRFKGHADPRSNLAYELAMILTLLPFLLVSGVQNLLTLPVRALTPPSSLKSLA